MLDQVSKGFSLKSKIQVIFLKLSRENRKYETQNSRTKRKASIKLHFHFIVITALYFEYSFKKQKPVTIYTNRLVCIRVSLYTNQLHSDRFSKFLCHSTI